MPLVLATDGNLYGTTNAGGKALAGTIFRITDCGEFHVLYNFLGSTDGANPTSPLVQGSDGNLYGSTNLGGDSEFGTIFQITLSGTLTTVHQMTETGGTYPSDTLTIASDGNIYGTTNYGGSSSNPNCTTIGPGCGTLFQFTPGGSFSVLHDFDLSDGWAGAGLLQHTNGLLYGDTAQGGIIDNQCGPNAQPLGCGVFYSLANGLPPFVSLIPYQAKVGKPIRILGQGFTTATTVSFNGTPATILGGGATWLSVVVPAGATSGPVTISTDTGALTSNPSFVVAP
jgi:uncharacterized repeat protein (TIGR03803 family)